LTGTESIDKKFNIRNKKHVVLKKGWMGSKKMFPGSGSRGQKNTKSGSATLFSCILYCLLHFSLVLLWFAKFEPSAKIAGLWDTSVADPGSGMETVRIRDGKKSNPGSGINIPDPQHCGTPFLKIQNRTNIQYCGSGSEIRCLFDPWIRNKHPGSATLLILHHIVFLTTDPPWDKMWQLDPKHGQVFFS